MKKLFLTIFVINMILSGCTNNSMDMYSYSDGSGNTYFISETSLIYNPVTLLESSSGEYSGGSPAEVSLTTEDYEMLKDLLESAINNPQDQIENREMMSGYIQKGDLGIVLSPKSASKTEIEKTLKNLLTK